MNDIIYAGKHSLTYQVPRHQHSSWEYIYCTGGEGKIVFDDTSFSYGRGDIVLIPPLAAHSNESDTGFTNIFLNMQSPTLNLSKPILLQDDANRFLLHAFQAVFFHFASSHEDRALLLPIYGDLLVCYFNRMRIESSLSPIVQEIENHITRNYPDCSYELDSYLQSLPFSYDYLRKLFKKEVGVTPHRFLNDKRLQTAAERLASPGDNVNMSEIARYCGFREPLYFSRMFKKRYGVSPTAYLKQSEQADIPDPENVKIMLPGEDE